MIVIEQFGRRAPGSPRSGPAQGGGSGWNNKSVKKIGERTHGSWPDAAPLVAQSERAKTHHATTHQLPPVQDLLEYYHMGCGGSKHVSVTVSAAGLALIEASTISTVKIPALDEIFQHAAQIMSTIEDINAGLISVVMAIRQARAPPLAAVTLAAVLSPPRLALALSHHAPWCLTLTSPSCHRRSPRP